METIIEPDQEILEAPVKQTFTETASTTKIRRFGLNWQAERYESARFGWMAILLSLQSCVGAVACFFISHYSGDVVSLSVCAAVTMGSNALFIALAPASITLIGFYISMVANIVLMIVSVI